MPRPRRSGPRKCLSVAQALEVVDDDLPDGAWMAMLEEMTGLDAGQISSELELIARRVSPRALAPVRGAKEKG